MNRIHKKTILSISIVVLILVLTVLSTRSIMVQENLDQTGAVSLGVITFIMLFTLYHILAAIFRVVRAWWRKQTINANKLIKNLPWLLFIAILTVYIWTNFIPHFTIHPPLEVNPDKAFERPFILENKSRTKPKEIWVQGTVFKQNAIETQAVNFGPLYFNNTPYSNHVVAIPLNLMVGDILFEYSPRNLFLRLELHYTYLSFKKEKTFCFMFYVDVYGYKWIPSSDCDSKTPDRVMDVETATAEEEAKQAELSPEPIITIPNFYTEMTPEEVLESKNRRELINYPSPEGTYTFVLISSDQYGVCTYEVRDSNYETVEVPSSTATHCEDGVNGAVLNRFRGWINETTFLLGPPTPVIDASTPDTTYIIDLANQTERIYELPSGYLFMAYVPKHDYWLYLNDSERELVLFDSNHVILKRLNGMGFALYDEANDGFVLIKLKSANHTFSLLFDFLSLNTLEQRNVFTSSPVEVVGKGCASSGYLVSVPGEIIYKPSHCNFHYLESYLARDLMLHIPLPEHDYSTEKL